MSVILGRLSGAFLLNCELFALTLLFALPLGLVVAFGSMSRCRLLSGAVKTFVWVIRGTPVVVQIMIMFFVIFASSRDKILIGCLSFGINSGAYVAEIIRAGILAVDGGQNEAARSLGLSSWQSMTI